MKCSLKNFFLVVLFFALCLAPGTLTAQEPQGAQTSAAAQEQPPPTPDLADLIPLATALSSRLTSLEKTATASVDVSQVEKQLADISALEDDYAGQFAKLQASVSQRAGRLSALTTAIKSASDSLAAISKSLNEKVRVFGNLRKEWLAEQQRWNVWRPLLLKGEPLPEVAATLTKVQATIDTALNLLSQQLQPLLTLQERVGALQTRIGALTADVDGLISLAQQDVVIDTSPPMFSAQYGSQLTTAIRDGFQTGLTQISWPEKAFFAQEGRVMILQGVFSLVLALLFFRHRQQLEQVEQWRFIAKRPIAAGLLMGVLSVIAFYEHPPDMVRLALAVLIGIAFVRLVGDLLETAWRRQFVYGLLILSITTDLCYVLGLPLALFRLYIFGVALVSLLFCLRWAAHSRRLKEARLYAWILRSATILFAAVLFTESWGDAELAEFLLVSSLRTLAIVLVFGLLSRLVRGSLEWAVLSSSSRTIALVGRNTEVVARRLALLCDVFIGVVLLAVLLMVWRVYDSPREAILGLLHAGVSVGSQRISIGLVVVAIGALGLSYFASWVFQTLLTERVLARRRVESGVSLSVARLVHYALITTGFVLALVVLGVDLTKMTLLASALGVGIGFGLQTIVNNFLCGLILLFERPLRVGDTIEIGGQWAKITKIGLRATTVRTFDQADVIVPNTDLITNQVTNWTLTDRRARGVIPVGVAYGSDVPLVMQTLKECALAHPGVTKSPEPQVLFCSFGDSSLDFELRAWVTDVDNRPQIVSDLNQDIDRRFRQAGIEIPFPQRDLHVRSLEPEPKPGLRDGE